MNYSKPNSKERQWAQAKQRTQDVRVYVHAKAPVDPRVRRALIELVTIVAIQIQGDK